MNKMVKTLVKGIIVYSTMSTCDLLVRIKIGDGLGGRIAANSFGFAVGREVADEVLDAIEAGIDAYNREVK